MMFLLLALACLVSAAEEPLPFSGKFKTIYLAGKYRITTAEKSQVRMLIREVKYFNQYRLMSMMFYVRKNGNCQLHTVWADKPPYKYCSMTWALNLIKCPKKNGTDYIPGTWYFRNPLHHFPKMYTYPAGEGGRRREPSEFYFVIHFASETTILFEAYFLDHWKIFQKLTGALATETNITEEMYEEYMRLTQKLKIPTENIENVYESDVCPKLEP